MRNIPVQPFAINPNYYLWMTQICGEDKYYIVSDELRRKYILYHNSQRTKHESCNPIDLYKYIGESNG